MGPRRRLLEARLRALVLLSLVLDVPVLARIVEGLTRAPRAEVAELDGVPVEIVRPAGPGPWPAWVFVSGAHPLRRKEPIVQRLTRGFARAGYVVVVPDVPGLGEGSVTQRTLEATVAVVEAATELPDVRNGRVALIGASMGAGLVVLAAARPSLAERISVVASVAPYADIERLVCLATTYCYEEAGRLGRYPVTALHRRLVARSLVSALPPGTDRDTLLAELDRLESEGLDPLAGLSADGLGDGAQAVVGLLGNTDPAKFQELYQALPADLRAGLKALSPAWACQGVRARVEIVIPPNDDYFPLGEALALARALPGAELTVTAALDHTRPRASLRRFGDFLPFGRFVVRSLAAASSP